MFLDFLCVTYRYKKTGYLQDTEDTKEITTMLEKDITNKILRYLKGLDHCYCFKEHGGSYGSSGIPDIICCYRGRFLAFEVKTPKGKTTPLQDIAIRKICEADGIALVVRSVDDVKSVINEMEESL